MEPTGYQEDLAYIHDVGFNFHARKGAPGIIAMLHECGLTQGLVVDLGCGSGLLAEDLVRAGYDVLGVDYSAKMLKMARQRVPTARFQRKSFLEVDIPSCVAITAIGEIFNYLFDAQNNPKALASFFGRVYDALLPGGLFIFDVAGPGRAGGPGKQYKNAQGEDWATLVISEEDPQARTMTRSITSFRRVGKLYRRSAEIHRLQLYPAKELAAVLRDLGFRTKLLHGYGEYRFFKGLVGIAARKPKMAQTR